MQSIQIQATGNYETFFNRDVEFLPATPALELEPDLDEALATVLHAVRESRNPNAMDALGTLLSYLENLERKALPSSKSNHAVMLTAAQTLTL